MDHIEILYHIFSFLDNGILFKIQSVCSFWNSVINRILVCPSNNSIESLLLRSSQKLKLMMNADSISGTACAQYLTPQGVLFIITYEKVQRYFKYSLFMIDYVGSIVKRKLFSETSKIYPNPKFFITKDLTFVRIDSRNQLSYYINLKNYWISHLNNITNDQFFEQHKKLLTFQSSFSKPNYLVNNNTHLYQINIIFCKDSTRSAYIDIGITYNWWFHERFLCNSYQQYDVATNKSIILFYGHSTENKDFYVQIEQHNEIFSLLGMKIFDCSTLDEQNVQYNALFCHQRQRFFLTKIFKQSCFRLKPLVD
jgi:hypothetical protein